MAAGSRSKGSGSNWKHDRRSRHERGYGSDWDKLRKQAMDRDFWLCQPCKRKGRLTPATECDHITPKSQGGKDVLSNLQAICTDCHRAKTAKEAAEAQGHTLMTVRRVGLDGYPIE
jgi:5-methylcytosine-specific restriction enzyme A